MSGLSKLIRELVDFLRFYRQRPKAVRDVVFYAEDAASFDYFEGLIEELTLGRGLDVAYVTSDINDPVFGRVYEGRLRPFYINRLLALFVILLDSKLLVMTMPDLHQFHIRRSERGAHHVYMFHNIGSSFPVIRFGALFHYDTVFCVGPHHETEIRAQEELYGLNKKNLVDFGYYRLEKVRKLYEGYTPLGPSKGKARVLIGPTWGDESILNLCGRDLVRSLLDGGYEVVVRPHPMTRKHHPQVLDALNDEFSGHENYSFEGNISMLDSLFAADVLVCDWSGFAYEYAFGTERPVLFVDVPRKVVNERYTEVGIKPVDEGLRHRLGEVISPSDISSAGAAIDRLIADKGRYVDEILKAREELVYNFMGSSNAGADFITGYLSGEIKA